MTWLAVAGADSYKIRWTKGGKKYGKWVSTSWPRKTHQEAQPEEEVQGPDRGGQRRGLLAGGDGEDQESALNGGHGVPKSGWVRQARLFG